MRGLKRGSVVSRLLGLRVRIPRWQRCVFLSAVCCQVEVTATSWSLVQRSPTDCVVSECDRQVSVTRRHKSTRDCRVTGKNKVRYTRSSLMLPERFPCRWFCFLSVLEYENLVVSCGWILLTVCSTYHNTLRGVAIMLWWTVNWWRHLNKRNWKQI